MLLVLHRRTCQFLAAHVVLSFLAVSIWIFHALGEGPDIPQLTNDVAMAQQIRINSLRLTMLEGRMADVETAHAHILWLLVGNLAAGVGALATYLFTHPNRRREDLK